MESADNLGNVNNNSEYHISPYTMTEDELRKRSKQRNAGRLITQCYATLTACTSAVSFGTALGWPMAHYHLLNRTCSGESWIWSLVPLGCCIGLSILFYGDKKLGPKKTILIDIPLYMLSYMDVLRLTRLNTFLIGLFGLINISSSEQLLIDAVHRKNLKYMIIIFRTSQRIGYLLTYLLRSTYGNIEVTFACVVIPFINALLLIIMPESPMFLYGKQRIKSVNAISWYQGPNNVYSALELVRANFELSKESNAYMLFSKAVIKAMLIIGILNFFRVCSGYYMHMFYRLPYYEKSVVVYSSFIDNLIYSINLVVCNFCANCVHIFYNLGVRRPLLISSTVVTITLIMQTLYMFFLHEKYINESFSKNYYFPLILQTMLVIGYELGYSICTDVLVYDYVPYEVHSTAKFIIYSLHWFYVFLVTNYYIILCECKYYYMSFLILAVISLVGMIYCYFYVIESKGKNFAQLQMELGGRPIGSRSNRKYLFSQINGII